MIVTFAVSTSGRNYFEKFLSKLSIHDCAAILAIFQDIQKYGFDAKGCHFRQIEGKLWEIKIRAPQGNYRFFYVTLNADHIHVLHSYKKQSQKAPLSEINVARKRLKEMINYEK